MPENNRAVKNARIDLLSADKRIWETIAMGLPQLGLSANYQHQFVIPELNFGLISIRIHFPVVT